MRKLHWRIAAWVLSLSSIITVVGCSSDEQPTFRVAPGVMTGTIATIDSVLTDNYGKWVLVNVWATWCRPCIAETPDLVAFTEAMSADPFTIVAISTDTFTDDDTTAVRKVSAFQTTYSIPYTNIVYTGSIDELANRFELSGAIPTSILYDPQGQLAQQFVGKLEQPQFTAIENFVR
jgi:thiol-disulfide isomerase/thioredoxin